jgi:hypothetical protein
MMARGPLASVAPALPDQHSALLTFVMRLDSHLAGPFVALREKPPLLAAPLAYLPIRGVASHVGGSHHPPAIESSLGKGRRGRSDHRGAVLGADDGDPSPVERTTATPAVPRARTTTNADTTSRSRRRGRDDGSRWGAPSAGGWPRKTGGRGCSGVASVPPVPIGGGVPPDAPARQGVLAISAEGRGFEPRRRLPAYTLSRRAPSSARASLRGRLYGLPLGGLGYLR